MNSDFKLIDWRTEPAERIGIKSITKIKHLPTGHIVVIEDQQSDPTKQTFINKVRVIDESGYVLFTAPTDSIISYVTEYLQLSDEDAKTAKKVIMDLRQEARCS